MPTLYLHIGHDKTGSSFLQSAFANSAEVFLQSHLVYPLAESMKAAKAGKVSEGNGGLIFDDLQEREEGKSYFFSSELIFQSIYLGVKDLQQDRAYLDQLRTLVEGPLFDRTKILLYIRNPIAHTISHYQQMVKRGGMKRDIDTFFSFLTKDGIPMPSRTRKVLEFLKTLSRCEVTILNYSRSKNLLHQVEEWLALSSPLQAPENEQVNRSLSAAELRLQIALNKRLGNITPPLSDYFVDGFPDLVPRKVYPGLDQQKRLMERCQADLEWINQWVEPGHEFELDYQEPSDMPDALRNKHYELIAAWMKDTLDRELSKAGEKPQEETSRTGMNHLLRMARTIIKSKQG